MESNLLILPSISSNKVLKLKISKYSSKEDLLLINSEIFINLCKSPFNACVSVFSSGTLTTSLFVKVH